MLIKEINVIWQGIIGVNTYSHKAPLVFQLDILY